MKKCFLRTASIFLAAVLFLSFPVHGISAEKAIVMDADTGRILFQRRADEKSLIASTTKIMTALVICQQCNVLDRVQIPKEAVGIEGSSMYLREGEILTVQELLYGLMLHSGNDAAVALAIYAGGTVEGFVEMMNDKARMLGMDHTHFENPNGLDGNLHYSTARDLAVLSAYAMKDPVFSKTVSTKQLKVGDRFLKNHNKLLWNLEGADGIKTGYTKAAGRILVSSATRDNRRMICVTINAPDDWTDHKTLLNQGFSEFQMKKLVSKGETIGKRHIASGLEMYTGLIAEKDFSFPLRDDEKTELWIETPWFAYAPVEAGQEAGSAYITLEGKIIGEVPLVYQNSVAQTEEKSIFQKWFGD